MSNVNVAAAAGTLANQGTLSRPIAASLATNSRDVQVPDLSRLSTDPCFACFLIDTSGSMSPYRRDVIDGQHIMVDTLRASAKCKKGALFVVQYLFSDHVDVLNPFTQLGASAGDGVKLLDASTYDPKHGTALYESIFYMLQDMAANIANAEANGVAASFTVGVITDGEDTEGGVQPSEIKNTMTELQTKGYLKSSVILGLVNADFDETMLQELKGRLGFQSAIALSQSGHDIRQAFLLGSQMASSAASGR
jgi:uncharacterized protein YegL